MNPLSPGTDQLIDAATARSLHADATRAHALVAWVVLWDLPAWFERYAAMQPCRGREAVAGAGVSLLTQPPDPSA